MNNLCSRISKRLKFAVPHFNAPCEGKKGRKFAIFVPIIWYKHERYVRVSEKRARVRLLDPDCLNVNCAVSLS